MGCLDGLIGDDNGCATMSGRLYLKDIGIEEAFVSEILTKDAPTAVEFMADRRRLATEYITRDVLTHYDPYIIGRTFIDRDRLGYYDEHEQLLTGDADYAQGIVIEVCTPAANTQLMFTRVEFYGETTGDIVVTFTDLRDGTTIATETIAAIAGEVATLDIDVTAKCFRDKKRIFVSTDQDVYYKATFGGRACSSCSRGYYQNGVLHARMMRVLRTDKFIWNNMLPTSDTGGLSLIASVMCDNEGWLCEVKPSLALPVLYLLGWAVCDVGLNNYTRWGIQNLRHEDLKDRRDQLHALYAKTMDDLYRTMPLPKNDLCFVCDHRTSTGVILP